MKDQSVAAKLWEYQSERFPLKKTIPLLAVFSAASITLSANLTGRSLPGITAYIIGFVLVFILFFQLRVCDEVKDHDDDMQYRPERPIPRGLISLRAVVLLGIICIPIAIALALLWGHQLIWLLILAWLWLVAMTFEFGVPAWLKARPVMYLLSHMAIMPLIDLLLTGIEWLPNGSPHPALWLFIALSFTNGCVLEIGRKLWAPHNERAGVDSYSSLWGPKKATTVWLVFVALSLILLIGVGVATRAVVPISILGILGAAVCLRAGMKYQHNSTAANEKTVDTMAGLWVFLCYASAGFIPLFFNSTPVQG